MKNRFVLLMSLALITISCNNTDKNASQTLVQDKPVENIVHPKVEYADSISLLNSKLNLLNAEKGNKANLIQKVGKQRDSLKNMLAQLDLSIKAVNDSKINPGISGVNNKLNELKGLKESLEEQVTLQNKEIELANKKIQILEEEQSVYKEQQQALIDKGAAPKEFVYVDTLLGGINSKIKIQKDVIKNLERSVNDTKEQVDNIKQQREVLSKNIRNNYSAKQLFEEYHTDEKLRLEKQLENVTDNLNILLGEASSLDTDYMVLNSKKINLESLNTKVEIDESSNGKEIQDMDNGIEKSNKLTLAAIVIIALGVLMALLYFIGKRKKNNKKK